MSSVCACVQRPFHWRLQAWVTQSLQCMLNLPLLRDEAFWRSLCNQQEEKGQPYSTRRGAMKKKQRKKDGKVGRLRDVRTVRGGKDQVQKFLPCIFIWLG